MGDQNKKSQNKSQISKHGAAFLMVFVVTSIQFRFNLTTPQPDIPAMVQKFLIKQET